MEATMASYSSIGSHLFVRISDLPAPPQQQIELESRAGRHGLAAWLTGVKGQPFELTSWADVANGLSAVQAIGLYSALVGAGPQAVVYGGIPLAYHVLVLGVQPVEVTSTLLNVGGNLGISHGLCVAKWQLVQWVW
jgi:hypothetical protein